MILCQTDSVIVSYTSLGAKNTNATIGELLFRYGTSFSSKSGSKNILNTFLIHRFDVKEASDGKTKFTERLGHECDAPDWM